jgi:hypothetical protein
MLRLITSILLLFVVRTNAFAPLLDTLTTRNGVMKTSPESSLVTLWSEENKEKKKGGLDGKLRSKLLSESIAPWRTLRLFLYGSLGSGAFIGGLINTSGAIAASSSPEFNLNPEVRLYLMLSEWKILSQA